MKTKKIAKQGIVAAIYVALTVALSAISFGAIQVRVSASMYQLIAYNKKYAIGLMAGVLIANAFSPLGPIDLVFGGLTSLVGFSLAILINRNVQNKNAKKIVVAVCVVFGTIFVALELHILYHIPVLATWATVAAGQAVSQIIGIPVFTAISKAVEL